MTVTAGKPQGKGFWSDADVIYTYSRAQAIEDGVLIDVTKLAKQAGIRYPMAITTGVMAEVNDIPARLKGIQDTTGRLWDVIWMYRCNAARNNGSEMTYRLRMDRNVDGKRVTLLTLKAHCGPGDHMEPVITIMLEDED
jgi:hypothetical protein